MGLLILELESRFNGHSVASLRESAECCKDEASSPEICDRISTRL